VLGEFEYLWLSTAARLGEKAYGAVMRNEIERLTGRQCSLGAMYTTMERLERKGFIETWMGNAVPRRGGRAKRMVRVTTLGICEATTFYRAMIEASRGASWVSNDHQSLRPSDSP
jgi:DNA-binding PadR family transcriptional regulator